MVFIESRAFNRRLLELGGENAEAVLSAIPSDLLQSPQRGRLVPGLGGVRKARTADPGRGKGKRGGLCYLYLHFAADHEIYLLYLFGKDQQEDLTPDQRRLLLNLAAESRP